MIKKEYYCTREDGVKLYRTYSTDGFMMAKVGTDEVYEEAIDVEGSTFEYEEIEYNNSEHEEQIEELAN